MFVRIFTGTLFLATLISMVSGDEKIRSRVVESEDRPAHSQPPIRDLDNAAFGSQALAEEAARKGLTVSSAELSRRIAGYRQLYPVGQLDSSKVRAILMAEKYLASKGMRVDDAEVARSFPGQWAVLREAIRDSGEHRQLLRTQTLLQQAEVDREVVRLKDLVQIDLREKAGDAPEWDVMDLQISDDTGACVAWSGSDCFVGADEFNAACTQYRMPASLPRDSAKASVLRGYMLAKRRADQVRRSGSAKNADSILGSFKKDIDMRRWTASAFRYGTWETEERKLQAAYGRYYGRFFAARRVADFEVIGSSDSGYVDSLFRLHRAGRKKTLPGKGTAGESSREPRLPWVRIKGDDLPAEWDSRIDSLRVGRTSRPFRTPYGFFFIRMTKVSDIPEVPYDKALYQLIYLATRDKFLERDSVAESQARRFYRENQARYAIPDTLSLLAWLIPGPVTKPPPDREGSSRGRIRHDTAVFKPLQTNSLSLPEEVRVRIQAEIRKDSSRVFLGPMREGFGTWYFSILSRKPAKGFTPYRLVRSEILERISAPLPELDRGMATEEAIEEVFLTIRLSEDYQRPRIREKDGMSDQKESFSPSPEEEVARMRERLEKYRREDEALLGEARLDPEVIFR